MTISSLKDLKKLIQLCQSQGIRAIKVDNIELELGSLPVKTKKYKQLDIEGLSPEAMVQVPQMERSIATDELTDEELLFYSADPQQ